MYGFRAGEEDGVLWVCLLAEGGLLGAGAETSAWSHSSSSSFAGYGVVQNMFSGQFKVHFKTLEAMGHS